MLTKQRGQFVAHHFDNLLVRRKLHHHFGANGFGADVGEQFVGDAHVDVALEQRFANFRECGVQMLVGQLALAA